MSFLVHIDPHDKVEGEKGLLESFLHSLTRDQYVPFVLCGNADVDAKPARLDAKAADDLLRRFQQADFARIGVYIGPRRVISPHLSARIDRTTGTAHLIDYLGSLNRKNAFGRLRGADEDVGAFAMDLFNARPDVGALVVPLPLPARWFAKRLRLRQFDKGVVIEPHAGPASDILNA
jgi:hypothetical protein